MTEKIRTLKQGVVLKNDELAEIFICSTQGGMRRSKKTNSLVLVSNRVKSIYRDRWVDDVLHYTGMGQGGDQKLDASQNKTLARSASNGVQIYLFEVFIEGQYTYAGRVHLCAAPYQEIQPDETGAPRKVWVFQLGLTSGRPLEISEQIFAQEEKKRERQARKLSDVELNNRAKHLKGRPGNRKNTVTVFERNPWVIEYAKRWAKGVCQLCDQQAPFKDASGDPFLETHHIIWLARGGDDTRQNTVALCPNCHRRMHVLDLSSDRDRLTSKVVEHLAKSSAPAQISPE